MVSLWNYPGERKYDWTDPLDVILQSQQDYFLRGYWLARDVDGQLCFVSDQKPATEATGRIATDGYNEILIKDGATEITYDTEDSIMEIERYS
jgi:hypothetical protein